jgi:hypothetical protein
MDEKRLRGRTSLLQKRYGGTTVQNASTAGPYKESATSALFCDIAFPGVFVPPKTSNAMTIGGSVCRGGKAKTKVPLEILDLGDFLFFPSVLSTCIISTFRRSPTPFHLPSSLSPLTMEVTPSSRVRQVGNRQHSCKERRGRLRSEYYESLGYESGEYGGVATHCGGRGRREEGGTDVMRKCRNLWRCTGRKPKMD